MATISGYIHETDCRYSGSESAAAKCCPYVPSLKSENAAPYAIVTNHPLELEDSDFIPIIQDLDAFYNRVLTPFGLNQDEMIHAARMFNSTLHGFVLAEKAGLFLLPQSIDESFEWIVNTLIDALEQRRKI